MKKISIAIMVLTSMGVYQHAIAAKDTVSILELSDPNYPGGSYDALIEMQKKVDEVSNLEMKPNQVDTIKNILLNQKRASASPYTHTAKPVTRSLNINFSPGVTPPVVRLSSDMLTTFVFTDAAGNPWNIESVALNREYFSDGSSIQQGDTASAQKGTNILSIEPLSPVAYGNIAIKLQGLDTPVILMLSTGQSEVDVRIDARVSALNPNRPNKGSKSKIRASVDIDDSTLLFVDGTPPEEAMQLKTSSQDVEAWEFDDSLIIRTKHPVLFPSYGSSVTSASGVTAYKLDNGINAVTFSRGGAPLTVYIERP